VINWMQRLVPNGVAAALGAALLFGAGTPLAKLLLDSVSPWLLAGLLYLGAGLGLMLYRCFTGAVAVTLLRHEMLWFAGAVVSGGIVAPVLLMLGLASMPVSGASLLLNAECVFTALLAWFACKENFDGRIALGMGAIVAGAAILSWPMEAHFAGAWAALAVIGACLAWGIDNNLTRKVSLADASWIAAVKGLVAGSVNLILALLLGASFPSSLIVGGAMVVGFLAYGLSLTLFVVAMRHLGTARTGAYFSVAPFVGALLALAMGESLTLPLVIAGGLMAIGVWLHLTERHAHQHTHERMDHRHHHAHDSHHQHDHEDHVPAGLKHSHRHLHEGVTHAHPHFPDAHHRHSHRATRHL
jgi:drug/metabolite transporter (DMT)-like permease